MVDDHEKISRRDFVKKTGTALVGIGLSTYIPQQGTASENSITSKRSGEKSTQNAFRNGSQPLIIDVHRHCFPKPSSTVEGMMQSIFKYRIGWDEHAHVTTVTVDDITSVIYPDLMDIDAQIKGQIQSGVTRSLLSGSMFLETMCQKMIFVPDMELNKRLNDLTAGLAADFPDQLSFMATVNPFHHDSIKECERCFNEMEAKGISIGTSWDGEYLDSPKLDYFWEYVQDRDQAIFLHPPLIPIGADWMNAYKLEEMVGRPFDTTMTVSRMIFSGVFDRYPKLKIVVPHMGGALPNVIGRLDFGYRLGYEGLPGGQEAVCKRRPSEYVRTNLYADTMGFSPHGIKHCIDLFGVDRVLFGTDYAAVPFIQKEHVEIVKELGLSREDQQKIFWENANNLFRLIEV